MVFSCGGCGRQIMCNILWLAFQVWCKTFAGNSMHTFYSNSWGDHNQSPWLWCCCCESWRFSKDCLCSAVWLVWLFFCILQNLLSHLYSFSILLIFFFSLPVSGLLKKSIGLLDKTIILACKLEFLIYMDLNVLSKTGRFTTFNYIVLCCCMPYLIRITFRQFDNHESVFVCFFLGKYGKGGLDF